MASRTQEYVTHNGKVTTNSLEGFHGLALKYCGKRIDLHHSHYTCKTNMAICHKVLKIHIIDSHILICLFQNLGPLWKLLCLWEMGVDVLRSAVATVVIEHSKWHKQQTHRRKPEYPKYR